MSKVHGPKTCYVPIRENATQVIVSYDFKADGKKNAYWQEVYFNKNRTAKPSLEQIKAAVLADINRQTDEKILKGFVWTPEGGEPVNVWLSLENQQNFSEAHNIAKDHPEAILPVKFKISENEDGTPIYHTFETFEELDGFYLAGAAFKVQCLQEGWQRKDSMDWSPYEPDEPETQS